MTSPPTLVTSEQGVTLGRVRQALDTQEQLKEELRQSIMAKRRARGEQQLQVEFREPLQMELTPAEMEKKERRREQNRRAAQRCRNKKRMTQNNVIESYEQVVATNRELQDELDAVKRELHRLQSSCSQHHACCPHFAKVGQLWGSELVKEEPDSEEDLQDPMTGHWPHSRTCSVDHEHLYQRLPGLSQTLRQQSPPTHTSKPRETATSVEAATSQEIAKSGQMNKPREKANNGDTAKSCGTANSKEAATLGEEALGLYFILKQPIDTSDETGIYQQEHQEHSHVSQLGTVQKNHPTQSSILQAHLSTSTSSNSLKLSSSLPPTLDTNDQHHCDGQLYHQPGQLYGSHHFLGLSDQQHMVALTPFTQKGLPGLTTTGTDMPRGLPGLTTTGTEILRQQVGRSNQTQPQNSPNQVVPSLTSVGDSSFTPAAFICPPEFLQPASASNTYADGQGSFSMDTYTLSRTRSVSDGSMGCEISQVQPGRSLSESDSYLDFQGDMTSSEDTDVDEVFPVSFPMGARDHNNNMESVLDNNLPTDHHQLPLYMDIIRFLLDETEGVDSSAEFLECDKDSRYIME